MFPHHGVQISFQDVLYNFFYAACIANLAFTLPMETNVQETINTTLESKTKAMCAMQQVMKITICSCDKSF